MSETSANFQVRANSHRRPRWALSFARSSLFATNYVYYMPLSVSLPFLLSYLLIWEFFLARFPSSPINLPNAKAFRTCTLSWHSSREGGAKVSNTKRVPDFRSGTGGQIDLRPDFFPPRTSGHWNGNVSAGRMSSQENWPKCSKGFRANE